MKNIIDFINNVRKNNMSIDEIDIEASFNYMNDNKIKLSKIILQKYPNLSNIVINKILSVLELDFNIIIDNIIIIDNDVYITIEINNNKSIFNVNTNYSTCNHYNINDKRLMFNEKNSLRYQYLYNNIYKEIILKTIDDELVCFDEKKHTIKPNYSILIDNNIEDIIKNLNKDNLNDDIANITIIGNDNDSIITKKYLLHIYKDKKKIKFSLSDKMNECIIIENDHNKLNIPKINILHKKNKVQ